MNENKHFWRYLMEDISHLVITLFVFLVITSGVAGIVWYISYLGYMEDTYFSALALVIVEAIVIIFMYIIWYVRTKRAIWEMVRTDQKKAAARRIGKVMMALSIVLSLVVCVAVAVGTVMGVFFAEWTLVLAMVAIALEALIGNIFLGIVIFPLVYLAGPESML